MSASIPFLTILAAVTGILACAGEKPPVSAPSVFTSPASRIPITAADARKLFTDFQTALRKELKAQERVNADEYKAFKVNQARELKRWKEEENRARKQFFSTHSSSAERRVYMHDRNRRYDEYVKAQAQARTDYQKLQEEKMRGFKSQQMVRVREFQDFLTRNEKPPAWLWGESAAGG